MASRWDAFWGYDIVTSQGLLDRIFQKMDVDSTSWQGLKSLPLVSPGFCHNFPDADRFITCKVLFASELPSVAKGT